MEKILTVLFIIAVLFTSCASTVESVNPMSLGIEFDIEIAKELEGRIFMAYFTGGMFNTFSSVKKKVIKDVAKKTIEMGYEYFVVLNEYADSENRQINYSTPGQYSSRNVKTPGQTYTQNYISYYYGCIFLLLKNEDLEYFTGIQTASDYL